MIEFNGKNYVLKYNIGRIEMIEASTGRPVLAEFNQNKGMLSIASLKLYFAYGLKEDGAAAFVPTREATEIAQRLIESEGYAKVCGLVVGAIERDCPFFFQAG